MRIESVVFDCHDAAPLARFWADALGWSVAPYDEEELERLASKGIYDPEDDPSVMVQPPAGTDLPVLFFTEVPEEKASRTMRIQEAYAGAAAVPLQLATR
ncbi:MAG: VOC family protein, partial [Actinomycetota bacterium]